MRHRVALLVHLALGLAACQGELRIFVDLKTDLRPGLEFRSVVTTTDRGPRAVAPASEADEFVGGRRVAELRGLSPGTVSLRVELLDADRQVVIARTIRVPLASDTAVTVLVTGDCVGVSCPEEGGPRDRTECLAGRCVAPECVVESPEACPAPLCASALDCASTIACARGTCVDDFCLFEPDDSACGAREWCDPYVGCRLRTDEPRDGGVDSGGCDAGAPCDPGERCAIGRVACDASGARCEPAGPAPAGTPCRPAAAECDAAESCNGTSTACPADRFASGVVCRASQGRCDRAESCNGTSPSCPTDRFAAGSECRSSGGPCDPAESCDGSGPDCPRDATAPNRSSCGASWGENGCGPIAVQYCMDGACVRDGAFDSSNRPSCGAIGGLCGFTPQCCGSGGFWCVDEPSNPIFGSSNDCVQCCRPGRCCQDGNPDGPCV